MRITVLAGGVGAARYLRGLMRALSPAQQRALSVVVNTGDDYLQYGVHISPDLDICTYSLAGAVNRKLGYGLRGDGHRVITGLARYGRPAWFKLGDADFANCLHRTLRLREGAGLARVSDEIRRAYGVLPRILPMSEMPCPTYVHLRDGRRLHFEEYLVRENAPNNVRAINLRAAQKAAPASGVCEALLRAETILVCPSNPLVSIGPILALREVRAALQKTRAPIVGVSPIIGGAPLKGPADKLMRGLGLEVSARGVARFYQKRGLNLHGFLIDRRDAEQRADVEALGLRCVARNTWMKNPAAAERLARAALKLAREISGAKGTRR